MTFLLYPIRLKVYDRRIERTVIDILLRFFQLQPDGIITFVCDSLDGSEYLRMRLFNQWYFKYNFQSDFSKLDYRGQLDEVKIFTSLVLRKDHAFHQNVSETFYWMCTELYSSDQ